MKTVEKLYLAITASRAGKFIGFNISGIVNFSKGKEYGASIAGIYNQAEGNVTGLHLAGIFAKAKKVTGLQFSLINYSEDLTGVQLGLINICKNSSIPFMFFINAKY